jgi:hypothetical protein
MGVGTMSVIVGKEDDSIVQPTRRHRISAVHRRSGLTDRREAMRHSGVLRRPLATTTNTSNLTTNTRATTTTAIANRRPHVTSPSLAQSVHSHSSNSHYSRSSISSSPYDTTASSSRLSGSGAEPDMFSSMWCAQPMTHSALRRSFLESCVSTEEEEAEEEGEVCAFLRDEEGDLKEERGREVEDVNPTPEDGRADEMYEAEFQVEHGDQDGLGKTAALSQEGTTARLSRMPTFIVPSAMSVQDVTLASVVVESVTPTEKIKPEEEKACQGRAGWFKEAGERAGQFREEAGRGIPKQQVVGCAPLEAMGYAHRPVVGLESDAEVEGSVATFVSCESFGSRMY